ncbi:hypothetical protein AURDEDRAFT_154314 [Auricularia subglabra TFB-10046 SS5]|uniref:F-box domain-containing protein n=1 Tax=Auricularia subglabra (strain TFB-10046 / SS5) TaxID=717982 RepID=J0LHM7_AURST|nr:hypothetical protein AURDEDRAFT_154314 [Auricularia subglabra TFB-10046 SS5]
MRTTFTTALHTLLHAAPHGQDGPGHLATLPVDGWRCILDFLSPRELAALCRTSRAFRAAATRVLYTHVRLESYGALYALVNTLEAAPELGTYILSFSESPTSPFLFDEPPPHLLTRALARMPNLRTLSLRSPIDIATSEFAAALSGLKQLEDLRLGDATPETLRAVMPYIGPLRALTLRRSSAGCPPWRDADSSPEPALASYLLATQHTLRALEIDGALLHAVLPAQGVWARVGRLRVHGASEWDSSFSTAFPSASGAASGCIADRCDWCAPRASAAAWGALPPADKAEADSGYPWDAMAWALLGAVAGYALMRI